MNFVCVCKNCGRTIDKEFIYCPWCGVKKESELLKENKSSEVFDELEKKQFSGIEKRLSVIFNKLNELERYFDSLLSENSK